MEAVEKNGNTALYVAVSKKYDDCVELLLENGANPQPIRARAGMSPLIHAIVNGDERITELLLAKNADVEVEGKFGTALLEATLVESENIVKLLLDKGANTEAKSRKNGTALNMAAKVGYAGIVRLLLEKQVNIESIDNDGKTSLLLAAEHHNSEIITLLLERGANLAARDKYGLNALQLANRGTSARDMVAVGFGGFLDTPTIRLLKQAMLEMTIK